MTAGTISASPDQFVQDLKDQVGMSDAARPDTSWAALPSIDRYLAVAYVENAVLGPLPEDLIETLQTLDDLHHFALVRSQHLSGSGPDGRPS